MTQFAFLYREWEPVCDAAQRAESAVHTDHRTACFYARRTLELAVAWAYKHDGSLKLPYQDNLSALIHDPAFKAAAGDSVFSKARVINTLGDRAVHGSRPIATDDAIAAVRELFHVCYWFARSYSRLGSPLPTVTFDPAEGTRQGDYEVVKQEHVEAPLRPGQRRPPAAVRALPVAGSTLPVA